MARFNPDVLDSRHQTSPFAERSDSVSFHPAVDDLYVQLMDAVARFDSEAIDALISEETLCVLPDGGVLEGRTQILKWFESIFRASRREGMTLKVSFELAQRTFCDGAICDGGHYNWNAVVGGSEMPLREGRFLAIFRADPENGHYLIDTMSVTPLLQGVEESPSA
jgi:ketosteroid isomerase-like protein